MNTSKEKLAALRGAFSREGLDGFIIPKADEYQGEFLGAYAERLPYVSAFTGSGGAAIVLEDKAVVMTDGRYLIQVKQQVDPAVFETSDITKQKTGEWLAENAAADAVIGYDPWLHTPAQIEAIEKSLKETSITLCAVSQNPVDMIWADRPVRPETQVFIFPDDVAGYSAQEKRTAAAHHLKDANIDAAIISLPDSICWLLNIRANDVAYIPLALSFAVLHKDGAVDWFIAEDRVPGDVQNMLGPDVKVHDPDRLTSRLKTLEGKILLDPKRSPIAFEALIGGEIIHGDDPCIAPKAIKTPAEQEGARTAHIRDGAAMVCFLHWLDEEVRLKGKGGGVTELSAAAKLQEFRALDPAYRGPSFPTIAGFGSNGAIIHYRAGELSNKPVFGDGLFLVDSGGQYVDGTTDITRTICIGEPSEEMRINFTRVLKGHIALAMAQFDAGTVGVEIDALARAPLKEAGLDYAHGTGHGVGCYLAVHEEAASISPRGTQALEAGMLISNEPGYYKEDAYGIRIENLVLVQDAAPGQLCFETVTLCPIDRRLIVPEQLSPEERTWLNQYHARVNEMVSLRLGDDLKVWLAAQTRPI